MSTKAKLVTDLVAGTDFRTYDGNFGLLQLLNAALCSCRKAIVVNLAPPAHNGIKLLRGGI